MQWFVIVLVKTVSTESYQHIENVILYLPSIAIHTMRSLKIISFFLLMLIASPALADGQGKVFLPDSFILAVYTVWALLAIAVVTGISFLFKVMYERVLKEKRRTVIRMIICSFVLPSLYAFVAKEKVSLYTFGSNYSRSESESIFWLIITILTFAGFNVGYFITPKHEMRRKHSS